jgi:hypothetical protein
MLDNEALRTTATDFGRGQKLQAFETLCLKVYKLDQIGDVNVIRSVDVVRSTYHLTLVSAYLTMTALRW